MKVADPPGSSGSQRNGNPETTLPRMTQNDRILGLRPIQWAGCSIFFMILTLIHVGVTAFLLYKFFIMGKYELKNILNKKNLSMWGHVSYHHCVLWR